MILEAEIVRQVLGGHRQMVRVSPRGSRPREGHVYTLKGKKSALRCQITIISVQDREIDSRSVWEIRFKRGDHVDRPRLLAANPGSMKADYTSEPTRALQGAGEEVSARFQAKFAVQGAEAYATSLEEQTRRLQNALTTIRSHAKGENVNGELRRAEERIRQLRRGVLYVRHAKDLPSLRHRQAS